MVVTAPAKAYAFSPWKRRSLGFDVIRSAVLRATKLRIFFPEILFVAEKIDLTLKIEPKDAKWYFCDQDLTFNGCFQCKMDIRFGTTVKNRPYTCSFHSNIFSRENPP
jgi:hypothetical protein